MSFYAQETPQKSTRELLGLINTFSKVEADKINTQKSIAFPYTRDKLKKKSGKPPNSQLPKKIHWKNVTKESKYVHNQNFKTPKEEVEEHRRQNFCDCGFEDSENETLTKSNLQIQGNPHQNFSLNHHKNRKNIKIYLEVKNTSDSQRNPEQNLKCLRYHYN